MKTQLMSVILADISCVPLYLKNIGRVFNLDAITMLDLLYQIEQLGEIKINRTAGLDVIHINHERTFDECVDLYYESINK